LGDNVREAVRAYYFDRSTNLPSSIRLHQLWISANSMNSSTPFLLLMPSYNQAQYIADSVRSALAQDDPRWELWILDNSSDKTPEVMARFSDPRIRFHHIPERMDPGSCLNWMLERAVGRDFSYVHTDNILGPSYVRRFRAALDGHPLGLAYCDSRVIDDLGRYVRVYRRGTFDLPRLLSLDTLGVPFAATTELAKQMGGFSVRDLADDVRFCVSAFGLAHYIHVREPLVDYRVHSKSRTEGAGGAEHMHRVVLTDLMTSIVPLLEQRGLQPIRALEQAIRDGLDDLDLFIEDHWHRKLAKIARPWWRGPIRIDSFFFAGLVGIPGFSSKLGKPPHRWFIRDEEGRSCVTPWTWRTIRRYLRAYRKDLKRLTVQPRYMLPIWACMKIGHGAGSKVAFRIKNLDFRTLWVSRQLEISLGWRPLLDPGIVRGPDWLHWRLAAGTEPLLDCSGEIRFSSLTSSAN
jgi:glycosyltransferase involved in cell wall biosynthesis